MEQMLMYIEQLNELDTTDIKPMTHVVQVYNCFREDVVEEEKSCEDLLVNAPVKKNGMFCVPKTIGG